MSSYDILVSILNFVYDFTIVDKNCLIFKYGCQVFVYWLLDFVRTLWIDLGFYSFIVSVFFAVYFKF